MATFSSFSSSAIYSGTIKGSPVPPGMNNTDVVAPEFRLYIEGVQVPFEAISVNQSYNSLPTAEIQIPPESGLMDITKGYSPKVHIFYKDDNYGGLRLLFWGFITSSSYSRSRSQGSTYISFHCEHKNAVLDQVRMDFTGWANPNSETILNPNSNNATLKPGAMNSISMILEALKGLSGIASTDELLTLKNTKIDSAPVDKIDPVLEKIAIRLYGMPGVALNLWNQMKKSAYASKNDSLSMIAMAIPLVEEGVGFFKRMSGHPFLESQIQSSKEIYCHGDTTKNYTVLIPPAFKNDLTTAAQAEMTVKNLNTILGYSGELTSYYQLMLNFLTYCKYDVSTLASPAEIPANPEVFTEDINSAGLEKCTIETIIKPQIPFYYSPTCNVVLPRMHMSVNVNQNEFSAPTRVSALHDAALVGNNTTTLSYNAPPSFREAIAYNGILKGVSSPELSISATKGNSFSIPGKYEVGSGIRPDRVALPWWLVTLSAEKAGATTAGNAENIPAKGTPEYNRLMILNAEWKKRYGTDITQEDGEISSSVNIKKNKLNPYDLSNTEVKPFERLLFSTVDYEYSEKVASSRSGTVEMIFNPYIVPGYPMDVVDESPNHPSFHGFCTSVVHSITSRSVSTTASMVAVMTYAELSNYYVLPVTPFLQSVLNVVNGSIDESSYESSPPGDTTPFHSTTSTLIQNPVAKESADTFYRQVLGVGAAAPDDLIHFSSGRAYPLDRRSGVLVPRVLPGTGGLPNIKPHHHEARTKEDYLSSVGNLRLVSRPIESMDSISSKFSYNFIHLDRDMYNNSYINYVNPILAKDLFLEPGASLFLDYMEIDKFIQAALSRN